MTAKTFSTDDIKRLREAHTAINCLEAAKSSARPDEIRAINEAIGRWRITISFIEEG